VAIFKFIFTKTLLLIVTLFAASLFALLLEHLIPGNPVTSILGTSYSKSAAQSLTEHLGLNKPIWVQYVIWLKNFSTGNLGKAYSTGLPVLTLIKENYPETVELIVASQIIALVIAVPTALYSAWNNSKVFDNLFTGVSFGFYSIPAFVLGPIFVIIFAVHLRILPATGYSSLSSSLAQNAKDMLLPVLTLALTTFSSYYQILKAELTKELNEKYVDLAKAKGLSPLKIMLKEVMRPALVGLNTTAGLQISTLITGAFVIEYIFGLPGLGTLIVSSINSADYLVIQSTIVIVVGVVAALNYVSEILNLVIDPRIRSK
jgi:peptide/nickel transport system permease protein